MRARSAPAPTRATIASSMATPAAARLAAGLGCMSRRGRARCDGPTGKAAMLPSAQSFRSLANAQSQCPAAPASIIPIGSRMSPTTPRAPRMRWSCAWDATAMRALLDVVSTATVCRPPRCRLMRTGPLLPTGNDNNGGVGANGVTGGVRQPFLCQGRARNGASGGGH